MVVMATPDDFDSAAPAVADPVTTDDADRALYRRGVLLVLCSALTLSLNGLIFRLIDDATAWQVLFYRSAALAVAMTCLFALRHRHRTVAEFRRAGRSALLAGPVLGVAGVCFIQALDHTTVANTLFTASSVPLFAAVFAWVFLGERVGRATWIAIGVALCGIGVMVLEGLGGGTLLGNLLALATAVLFASFVVTLRAMRHVDMLAAVIVSALVSSAIGGFMAADFVISTRDLLMLLAWGGLLSCLGHSLFTAASRHVPAADLTLLGMSEMIIGPLWVWLAIDETPAGLSLLGGAIVASALIGWSLSRRKAR
jgi:drug/metabolite transporter (DMT)-like permease